MIDELFSEIVIGLVMGSGGALLAYFKKLSNTQKNLCSEIQQLRKALIILATALDRQSNRPVSYTHLTLPTTPYV